MVGPVGPKGYLMTATIDRTEPKVIAIWGDFTLREDGMIVCQTDEKTIEFKSPAARQFAAELTSERLAEFFPDGTKNRKIASVLVGMADVLDGVDGARDRLAKVVNRPWWSLPKYREEVVDTAPMLWLQHRWYIVASATAIVGAAAGWIVR
jgi:hypothetical protein